MKGLPAVVQALFCQFERTRKLINDWVAAKTKDRIQDIVPPGLPLPDTRLALANAIHFKAPWAEPFQERATQDRPFTVAPDTVVQRMAEVQLGYTVDEEERDALVAFLHSLTPEGRATR